MTQKQQFILLLASLLVIAFCYRCHAQCGSEFIQKKDLTISDTAFLAEKPIRSTVSEENALKTNARCRKIEINGTITGYKLEADGDIHCIVKDGSAQMIIELPNPECSEVKRSSQFHAMKMVREQFISTVGKPSAKMKKCNVKVDVTGSEFFDKLHGQAGAAKNGVEVHPALKLIFLNG